MRRAYVAAMTLALVVVSGSASAQNADEDARREFAEGRDAYDAKSYLDAATHFETAAALAPHGIAFFSAALAWDKADRPERAADAYARALALGSLGAEKTKKANERIASLAKLLGAVQVTLPAGSHAKLDEGIEQNAPSATFHGLPGDHTVVVRFATGAGVKRAVRLEGGTSTKLVIEAPKDVSAKADALPPEASPPPPEPADAASESSSDAGKTRRTIGLVVLGVGGATLLTSAIVAGVGLGKTSDYERLPTEDGYNSAKGLETLTNVTLITGIGLAAIGATLFFWPSSASSSPSPSPSANVSVGPTGAMVRGTF